MNNKITGRQGETKILASFLSLKSSEFLTVYIGKVTEISPGAVHTEFSEVRWKYKKCSDNFYSDFQPLLSDDIADAILYCATRPSHVDIEEMVIMPTAQASCNHISRKG